MNGEIALALAKSYVRQTLDGAGAIKGDPGDPGKAGITPHIGENKNWFIGETDTGIRAEGKDGQDGVDGSVGSSLDVYSTEETVVGTWIDGKPLYRKVLVGTTPVVSTNGTFSWGSFDTGSAFDSLLPVKGIVYSGSDSLTLPHTTNDGTGRIKTSSNRAIGRVLVGSNSSGLGGLPLVLIVEYTKTTDTATNGVSTTALMDAYEEGVNEA